MNTNLSVAIATFNEEENIGECLSSVKDIASEIIIVDGSSTDKTVEIARQFGAKVEITKNHPIFHINKQRSFDLCTGDWILYLDADESVSRELAKEIQYVLAAKPGELVEYEKKVLSKLFIKHTELLEKRDGPIGTKEGDYVAFFFPRLNLFLGKYLRFGGTYPDGVIRLFKRNKAYLPCKSVHEQMVVEGRVWWLGSNLLHNDSPNFARYLKRNSRYVNLIRDELLKNPKALSLSFATSYLIIKPISWFLITPIRNKGILDGWRGLLFSFFSALRFPRAYLRYLKLR